MIPTEFKDTVARKYGYKHFQELLGVYFKCTKTRIQAMKTTKVYINDSLVVLYGEWPVEPNEKYFSGDQWKEKQARIEYHEALKKAIAEAVPFEDQDGVKNLIQAAPLVSGFYEVDGLEWHSWHWVNPCTKLGDCQLTGDEYRRACYEGCKKQYRVARAVIKPLSNDWNKKESYQEGTDRSVKRVKDILESKPLSSGEKEEQPETVTPKERIVRDKTTGKDKIEYYIDHCPQCRTREFDNCHSMYCPMRKLSSVDTNIEEKKIFAPDKEHFDKMLLKELVWKLDREVWAHVPNPEPSEEWTTSKARERTRELIAEYIGDYDKLAAKSTLPVQEKPDFDRMIYDLQYTATDSAGHEVEVVNAYEAKELLINIWKNYVELETSRAEGWRKQYYDWKDLLLTTEEENRKLKQEIERLKQPLHPVKSLQDCKDEVAKKYGLSKFNSSYSSPEMDEAAELYASQFKTQPVQEDHNLLSVISDLGAWINQEIDITEDQEKLFKESKNRDMAARCDSSIRTYQKVIRRIEELKSKYTIIPKLIKFES